MLLKFTTADILNTTLINVATGELAFEILTTVSDSKEDEVVKTPNPPASDPSSFLEHASPLSSVSSTPTMASSSPAFVKESPSQQRAAESQHGESRRTIISDATGKAVADITWKGRHPTISICDEKVGALTDLFGSSTVRFLPKILAIPTRFDTEYVWNATADGLTLFDYDTETIKGTFHQNVIRIPTGSKATKGTSPTSPKSKLTSPSRPSIFSSSASSDDGEVDQREVKSAFIPTHLPGVGSNYLEFSSHPLAHDVELILSFLMMEILRRGRFGLTPYTFEKPKLWQLSEARDLLLRRLRRNTV